MNYLLVFKYAFVLVSGAQHVSEGDTLESAVVHACVCQGRLISLLFLSAEAKKLLDVPWSGILIYFLCLFSLLPSKTILNFFHVTSEDYLNRKLSNSSEFVEICRNVFIVLFTLSFLQNYKLISRLASIHVFGLNRIHPSNHG